MTTIEIRVRFGGESRPMNGTEPGVLGLEELLHTAAVERAAEPVARAQLANPALKQHNPWTGLPGYDTSH